MTEKHPATYYFREDTDEHFRCSQKQCTLFHCSYTSPKCVKSGLNEHGLSLIKKIEKMVENKEYTGTITSYSIQKVGSGCWVGDSELQVKKEIWM